MSHMPQVVEQLRGQDIICTSSGEAQVFAISETGQVFSWGLNREYKLLGNGGSEPVLTPSLIQSIIKISTSVNLSVYFSSFPLTPSF